MTRETLSLKNRGTLIYHGYVSEPHDTKPPPAVQYAYSCVTYTTGLNGVSDCEWIIPGTLDAHERMTKLFAKIKARHAQAV